MAIKSSVDAVTFYADGDDRLMATATRRKVDENNDEWVFNLHNLVAGEIIEGLPFETAVKTQAERDELGNKLVQALVDRRDARAKVDADFGTALVGLVPKSE